MTPALEAHYADPIGQAWLRLWVSLHEDSLLRPCLHEITPPPKQPFVIPTPPPVPRLKPRRSRPATSRPKTTDTAKAKRRAKREAATLKDIELSDWAKQLLGDPRITEITLNDVIDAIEDYFEIFTQMRHMDKAVYNYFRQVGAPLALRNILIWRRDTDRLKITNAASLPSFFGTFWPKTKQEHRDDVLQDRGFEFVYFTKLKTHATVAPPGTTVFSHNTMHLKRDGGFTKEELKQFPWVKKNWGYGWFVGVLPDGTIRTLPSYMHHHQKLPCGEMVHHSSFKLPPLEEMSDTIKDPHELSRRFFVVTLAVTASSVAGLQVTIKKGEQAARFGIPIQYAKAFFADRDAGMGRRRPILHLALPHERHLSDGRVIRVGEHLRGDTQFEWRGYQISVGAPGIHFPTPEGFPGALHDPEPGERPLKDGITVEKMGSIMERQIWKQRKPRFIRGTPDKYWDEPLLQQHKEEN